MEKNKLFGFTGKDVITGFVGVIIGKCSYISGCDQLLLTPRVGADNTSKDAVWFDSSRIEVVQEEELITLPSDKVQASPGPDRSAPIK